jgi:hypothetical protein
MKITIKNRKEVKMKNWKTTLAGLLAAAAQIIVLPINSWKDLIVPIATAIVGIFAADAK